MLSLYHNKVINLTGNTGKVQAFLNFVRGCIKMVKNEFFTENYVN